MQDRVDCILDPNALHLCRRHCSMLVLLWCDWGVESDRRRTDGVTNQTLLQVGVPCVDLFETDCVVSRSTFGRRRLVDAFAGCLFL